jgi:hypothetical protein
VSAIEPIVVVCHRDPDSSNEYRVFGAGRNDWPTIITFDYGHSDLSDADEFAEWAASHLHEAVQLFLKATPNAMTAAAHILETISETAADHGHTWAPKLLADVTVEGEEQQ